jgi:hypothetical protein
LTKESQVLRVQSDSLYLRAAKMCLFKLLHTFSSTLPKPVGLSSIKKNASILTPQCMNDSDRPAAQISDVAPAISGMVGLRSLY